MSVCADTWDIRDLTNQLIAQPGCTNGFISEELLIIVTTGNNSLKCFTAGSVKMHQ